VEKDKETEELIKISEMSIETTEKNQK